MHVECVLLPSNKQCKRKREYLSSPALHMYVKRPVYLQKTKSLRDLKQTIIKIKYLNYII